jgi:hypothetical protein
VLDNHILRAARQGGRRSKGTATTVPLNGRAPTATTKIFLKKREDYQIADGAYGQTGVAAGTFTAISHLVGDPYRTVMLVA